MIQRVQSIYLLVALVFACLSLTQPLYMGNVAANNQPQTLYLYQSNGKLFFASLLMAIHLVLAGVTIFLFKNRNLQLKLSLVGALLSLISIFCTYYFIKSIYSTGNFTLWSMVLFLIPICWYGALRGIQKDINLVKSYDRMR